jgi:hypothetical protein
VHLQPHHAQLRKKPKKSKKEPVWRSSTGASGLPRRRSGGSRWHPSQICRTWLPPQDLSSPSPSLYMDMGTVMIREKGVPRDGAMGGSMGSTRLSKPVAVAVWFGLQEIGEETCSSCIQLQRFSHHAHRILVQPVQVGLLVQEPWRRTRQGSLLRQHFLHYFSAEIPRGERAIRTSQNTPSTHSGE